MASLTAKRGTRFAGVLALVVLAAVALPVVGAALAQTPSPGPSTIEFLNPSAHSTIVSDKRTEGGDESYRLTAWVADPPSDAGVEFEIQVGTNTITLGPTQRVADDTWEYQWVVSGIQDGVYTMRAILFAGGTEIDRDTQEVTLRHGQLDPTTAAERVEFQYPSNGGFAGFYTPPQEGARSNIVVEVDMTPDTELVEAYYTTSPPGAEPQWTTCGTESKGRAQGTGSSGTTSGRGVRCTLASGDSPLNVTGLAAVAIANELIAAGDAVRVAPYIQVPTTVTTQSPMVVQRNACTDSIPTQVTDQVGRPVAGVSMDVHAAGPTDQLKFETNPSTSGGNRANQPPDSGNHTEEPGHNCSLRAFPPSPQGEHNRLGEADLKHIESADGSNDEGIWLFILHSPDPGDTQVTVFADLADNDIYCSNDPAAHTSLRWVDDPNATDENGNPIHQPATVQPEDPEAADCPAPPPGGTTPPPTSTPTSSPTGTATASPTPTPDQTLESGPCEGYPRDSRTPREDADGFVIVGDDGDEIIEGTDGDDLICGLGGHDKILGKAGNDDIHGGSGQDDLRGHAGQDNVFGGNGHDTIYGNKGHDTLRGGRHNDILRGGHHNDLVVAGRGHDVLRGGRRHDTLRGSRGNDELYGNRGNDALNGGPGWDTCRGGGGNDDSSNCEQ